MATTAEPATQPPGIHSSGSSSSTLPSSSSNNNSPTLYTNSPSKPYGYTSSAQAISNVTALLGAHAALLQRVRQVQEAHRESLRQLRGSLPSPQLDEVLNLPLVPSETIDNDVYGEYEHESDGGYRSESEDDGYGDHEEAEAEKKRRNRPDLPPAKRARLQRYNNYVPEEETIRNDYSQRYVDGGEWPQNWVLGAEPERRFEEYPKQQRLLQLKKGSVNEYALPPTYITLTPPSTSTSTPKPNISQTINASLSSMHPSKFDVILIDPPYSSSSSTSTSGFTWDNLQDLPIPSLAAEPSFVFLWVGSGAGEGLERGREILAKWGYRRCEDVVWVRTNKDKYRDGSGGPGTDPPTTSLLTRTKQHCLMGIRGTVRRSTDSWFVHCNVDTDVIIWEGDPLDPTRKPPEMYTLIENFCLGLRRLEVFGKLTSSLRRGWVTALAPGQEELLPKTKEGDGVGSSSDDSGRIYVECGRSGDGDASGSGREGESGSAAAGGGIGAGPPPGSAFSTSSSRASPSGDGDGEANLQPESPMDLDADTGITATRWNHDTWEEGIRELAVSASAAATTAGFGPPISNVNANGGTTVKPVVPMSAEIDALRPKSPVRPGQGGNRDSGGNNHGNNNNTGGGGGGGGGGHQHQQYHGGGGSGRGNINSGMNNVSTMAQPMAMSMSGVPNMGIGMGLGSGMGMNMGMGTGMGINQPILRFGGSSTVVVPSSSSGSGPGNNGRGGGGGNFGGGGKGNMNMNMGMGMGTGVPNPVMSMGSGTGGLMNMGMGMNPDLGMGMMGTGMGSGMNMNAMAPGMGGMANMGMGGMGMGMGTNIMGVPSMGVNGGGGGAPNMLIAQPMGSSSSSSSAGTGMGISAGMEDVGWSHSLMGGASSGGGAMGMGMGVGVGGMGMGMGGMGMGGMGGMGMGAGMGGMHQQQQQMRGGMAMNNMANLNNANHNMNMGMGMGNLNALNGMNTMNGMNAMNMNPGGMMNMNMNMANLAGGGGIPNLQLMGGMGGVGAMGAMGIHPPTSSSSSTWNNGRSGQGQF